jgi:hypothetical protein
MVESENLGWEDDRSLNPKFVRGLIFFYSQEAIVGRHHWQTILVDILDAGKVTRHVGPVGAATWIVIFSFLTINQTGDREIWITDRVEGLFGCISAMSMSVCDVS